MASFNMLWVFVVVSATVDVLLSKYSSDTRGDFIELMCVLRQV